MLQATTQANSLRELKQESSGSGLAVKAPPFFLQMAENMGVDHKELWVVLKATAFKGSKEGGQYVPPTDEQMYALMMVSNAYGLNPFTKEIYAFPDKQNGIVPVVGVDGWLRIANNHPEMDGYELRSSEKMITMDGAKECPEWMEGVVHRKDRSHPIVVREYLDECYRPAFEGKYGKVNGPWQTHTKRMLRHKALIQALRTAFGFAGVYEEDEAHRIIEAKVIDTMPMIEQGPDTSAFDKMAGNLLGDSLFMAFLDECAKASSGTVDEVKIEAAKDYAGFGKAYDDWATKQKAFKKNKGAAARVAAAEAAVNSQIQPEVSEELLAKREDVKAALSEMGVLDAVTVTLGEPSTWTAEDCAAAMKLGAEEAAKIAEEA